MVMVRVRVMVAVVVMVMVVTQLLGRRWWCMHVMLPPLVLGCGIRLIRDSTHHPRRPLLCLLLPIMGLSCRHSHSHSYGHDHNRSQRSRGQHHRRRLR